MDINVDLIESGLKNKGFYILEDKPLLDLVSKARDEYLHSFHQLPLHSAQERFTPTELQRKPWRKLAIGARNGLGESYAQFLQTTYFHEQDIEYPHLVRLFSKMIKLRNLLLKLPDDFGSCPERDLFWNACRIHHYPSGGGFMMAHKDTHFPRVLEGSGFPFLQIMIPLSKREDDFVTGGGFIVPKDTEQKYFFETVDSFGDAVLFDGGHITHGVDDVDGNKLVDFQSKSGRFAAFVNVYQLLK
jgi:hypothetical protein